MPRFRPPRAEYEYSVMVRDDGTPVRGTFEDGSHYYNIIAKCRTEQVTVEFRIIARTATLEDAELLASALNRHTVRA